MKTCIKCQEKSPIENRLCCAECSAELQKQAEYERNNPKFLPITQEDIEFMWENMNAHSSSITQVYARSKWGGYSIRERIAITAVHTGNLKAMPGVFQNSIAFENLTPKLKELNS